MSAPSASSLSLTPSSVIRNQYRTSGCGELNLGHEGTTQRISGWLHRKRDHGHVVFVDVRDSTGWVQCVFEPAQQAAFETIQTLRVESVLCLEGQVKKRDPEAINPHWSSGQIELHITSLTVLSSSELLPFAVNGDQDEGGDELLRLRYRYLDLRRPSVRNKMLLRSAIIASLRQRMIEAQFVEFQTPILTASSPEGARDFLVPSRLEPGTFYALPQAPQQFKQLLMVAGFDRYFQIAPCFRDEDSRADRSPGEFYQLDLEMSFVTQEDVLSTVEPILYGLFEEFAPQTVTTPTPFPRLKYDDVLLTYGSDKPDLRNPLVLKDVTAFFSNSQVDLFRKAITDTQAVVRALRVPHLARQPRRFFDEVTAWATAQGLPGLGYLVSDNQGTSFKGPLAKFLSAQDQEELRERVGLDPEDGVFLICAPVAKAIPWSGALRTLVGQKLNLIDENVFAFCWVVDFPMYEWNETTKKVDFSHNPFSMPQGGLEALNTQDPLTIKAYQYDLVCNGVELCSGAIRNHDPAIMYKAFDIAGYTAHDVEERFGGLLHAFRFGAPPHGGCAPGVDRIVMLLAKEPNIREITLFPKTQQAKDVMMGAPCAVSEDHLKELGLMLRPQVKIRETK